MNFCRGGGTSGPSLKKLEATCKSWWHQNVLKKLGGEARVQESYCGSKPTTTGGTIGDSDSDKEELAGRGTTSITSLVVPWTGSGGGGIHRGHRALCTPSKVIFQ